MAQSVFLPISTSYQKKISLKSAENVSEEVTFPLVLSTATESSPTIPSVLESAKSLAQQPSQAPHQSELRKLLDANGGAVHFTNLPLRTAEDFSQFAFALAGEDTGAKEGEGRWVPHVDKGQMVLRRPFARNVATANEGPPDKHIKSHNEFGLSPHHPAYILFFCLSAPTTGGETPITSSLALFDRLKESNQGIQYLEAIRKRGINYSIEHPSEQVASSVGGNGVFKASAFGPEKDTPGLTVEEKKAIVERRIKELAAEGGWSEELDESQSLPDWQRKGFTWSWDEDGGLRVNQRVPGVRIHPSKNVGTYFNNVATRHHYAKEKGTYDPPHTYIKDNGKPAFFPPPFLVNAEGADEPVPENWIDEVVKLQEELHAPVKWSVGDVLVIDNFATQHARVPWTGERKLLASLWDQPGFQADIIKEPIGV